MRSISLVWGPNHRVQAQPSQSHPEKSFLWVFWGNLHHLIFFDHLKPGNHSPIPGCALSRTPRFHWFSYWSVGKFQKLGHSFCQLHHRTASGWGQSAGNMTRGSMNLSLYSGHIGNASKSWCSCETAGTEGEPNRLTVCPPSQGSSLIQHMGFWFPCSCEEMPGNDHRDHTATNKSPNAPK